ncbi:hypothetical protein MMC07_009358 [Pseudocyphellaria aurata]|nr:hypothetical protein [Pseudocyphellaria aurata]
MAVTINVLPYELLVAILEEATRLNIREIPQYTYGLSQAPEPMRRDVRMQRVVRGPVGPDTLRWNATDAIRQVNQAWHDWACRYALASLYISRWRGNERWLESRILTNLHSEPSDTAVYQDPYSSLRKTVRLFSHSAASGLTSCVRRIWLDGYYGAETTALIFELLLQLPALEYLTLPWMALRQGTAEQWSRVLKSTASLELLSVNLTATQIESVKHQHITINPPLASPAVDFHHLTRLKIMGDTNHLGLADEDLVSMSRTAINLHEIHITGTSSPSGISIEGVMALVHASQESLRVLEYTPDLPSSPHLLPPPLIHSHPCVEIQQCHQLRNLTITLPSICTDLFQTPACSHWTGEIQIRTASICRSALSHVSWPNILHHARNLAQSPSTLSIEIHSQIFIFEPRLSRVHGPTTQLHRLVASSATSSSSEEDEMLPSGKMPVEGPQWKPHISETQSSPYSFVTESTFFSSSRPYLDV